MSLQDWGALGELIGGLAIIVSLIYVAVQIRQSTNAARVATSQTFTDQYMKAVSPLYEPGFSDVYRRGLAGLNTLEGSDRVMFTAFVAALLRVFESFYIQAKDGAFDSRLFDNWIATFIDLIAYDGVREVLEIRKHHYNPEFIEFLYDRLENTTPHDMYTNVNSKFFSQSEHPLLQYSWQAQKSALGRKQTVRSARFGSPDRPVWVKAAVHPG